MVVLASEFQVSFIQVDENQLGQRVDNFLLARLKGVPKTRIYRIIRKGEVRVNGKRIKPDYKLQVADQVRIPPIRVSKTNPDVPSGQLSQLIAASVLYEDDSLLIINKPAGIAVHAGTNVKIGLIDVLRHLYPDTYLELAHRLDKGTSGCIMVAKNAASLKILQKAFKDKKVQKHYHALVHGLWPPGLTEVNAALYKQAAREGERIVEVDAAGKSASTQFKVLKQFKAHTLLQASPLTGRTHQIRVHTMHAGHPICGDEKYSLEKQKKSLAELGIKRLCLHAVHLRVTHPQTGQLLEISAPYDSSFTQAMEILHSLK